VERGKTSVGIDFRVGGSLNLSDRDLYGLERDAEFLDDQVDLPGVGTKGTSPECKRLDSRCHDDDLW